MPHPWQEFVDDFWVPRGCLGCGIRPSHVTSVRWWFLSLYGLFALSNLCVTRDSNWLMISKSLGVALAIKSIGLPWEHFVDDFRVPRGCFGYQIHKSSVRALRWWFSSPYGLNGLSNPCVTRDSTSLIISESLGAVWAVKCMRHPWQEFVDDFFWGCLILASQVTSVHWWFLSP